MTAKLLLIFLLQSATILGVSGNTSNVDPQEAYCLAENIYYEARSEDLKGQFAVASVTLNRAKDSRFPDTVCGVVQQSARSQISNKTMCAFSWYCDNDKKGKEIPVFNKDGSVNKGVLEQFWSATIVAITALSGHIKDNTRGATHFHNPYTSNPAWKYEMVKTASLGNHDFYK